MKTAELFDVRGLVTIVTGAASGIGLAYAEVMADNGARVTLMDRDASSLEAAVRRLAERGGDVRGQTLDVTDRPGLRAGIDAVAAHYGRLDVVFANVGIDSPPGFLGMNGGETPAGRSSTFQTSAGISSWRRTSRRCSARSKPPSRT